MSNASISTRAALQKHPLYAHSSRIVMSEKVKMSRNHIDLLARAEVSTKSSTIEGGVAASLETLDTATLIVSSARWSSWSVADREMRNRFAGKPSLGL